MKGLKPIPDFPNYLIDTSGNVWSKHSKRYKTWCNVAHGYKAVQLWKNNKGHIKLIHRLVLEVFIGACPKGKEACHNDSNIVNNSLENLRWDTPKNNHKDAIKRGTHSGLLKGEKAGGAKLTDKQVTEIRKISDSTDLLHREIAKLYNISRSQVTRIINYVSRV